MHPGTVAGGGPHDDRLAATSSWWAAHVAHDCRVGSGIVLANHVLLAGHVIVHDRAILNGACALHHFTTVGRFAYVGGLTRITQDVHPVHDRRGPPGPCRGPATPSACSARAWTAEDVRDRQAGPSARILVSERLSTGEAIAQVEAAHPGHALVGELLASIRAAEAGRQGRAAEGGRDVHGA